MQVGHRCTTWSAKCHIPETVSAIILAEIPVLVRCCHAATDNKHLTPGVGLTPLYRQFTAASPLCRMALVPCIAISTGYILLIMFLCELARRTVAPLNDGLVKTALNEAIAAADLCGVCFELIISE